MNAFPLASKTTKKKNKADGRKHKDWRLGLTGDTVRGFQHSHRVEGDSTCCQVWSIGKRMTEFLRVGFWSSSCGNHDWGWAAKDWTNCWEVLCTLWVIQHGFPGNPIALFHHNNRQKERAESWRKHNHAWHWEHLCLGLWRYGHLEWCLAARFSYNGGAARGT